MKRRTFCSAAPALTVLARCRALCEAPIKATLYKNPQCTCCEGYAAYLRQNGFEVEVKPTNDLNEISQKAGVPENIRAATRCSSSDYVVDGHVPVEIVQQTPHRAAGHCRHHASRHADGIARNDGTENRDIHHLRRHQGRQGRRPFTPLNDAGASRRTWSGRNGPTDARPETAIGSRRARRVKPQRLSGSASHR